jgi:light-regulated signal transduction histidine kinase (bacteriophytochrome)
VTDTGVGIRAEDQEVIFEEFRQVEGPAGTLQEGTGLGLAITKWLISLHCRLYRSECPGDDAGPDHFEKPFETAEFLRRCGFERACSARRRCMRDLPARRGFLAFVSA